MKRKNLLVFSVSAVVFIALIWYFSAPEEADGQTIKTKVLQGRFVIDVTTTGELEARSSEKIQGPNTMALRNARIWQYTIEDIVPDGTVVDSGDWVATLDRSDLENKIKDQELEVEKLQTKFVKSQLDTTMSMRAARDELINLEYTLEEKQIIVDQSIYEPPATRRQVQLDLEKTRRTYKQTLENYSLKLQKAEADMREVEANLTKTQRKLDALNELKSEFVIKAPKAGMVNYKKGWDGKKQGAGAQISTWDNVVATLPNLSAMNSKTYINEIDISKVAVGQKVEIEIDAFPGRKFTGEVHEVANMGEQMRNSNAKVFEVIVFIHEFDSILRPSMTTKNTIITNVIEKVLHIPIECVSANDSISYVFRKGKRKQVIPGKSNESEIIILAGLEKGDEVYLVPPKSAEDWPIKFLDKEIMAQYNKQAETETTKTEKKEPAQVENEGRKGRGKGRQ
ncbi:MAG: efflux RND transporter periplasmic adaptor subunit [Bacteroidales bacterium]|nr:efflux RND transporter periplasmic adaptor subunit [Bacteroidales bacterium]